MTFILPRGLDNGDILVMISGFWNETSKLHGPRAKALLQVRSILVSISNVVLIIFLYPTYLSLSFYVRFYVREVDFCLTDRMHSAQVCRLV